MAVIIFIIGKKMETLKEDDNPVILKYYLK